MKTNLPILTLAFALGAGLALAAVAQDKHDPAHKATPKGGRLLERTEPQAEFYLEKDHTVTITFHDAALKSVPVDGQTVTVIADAKAGKAYVEFEKKGDVLVSKTKLPEGDGYNVVVQFKQTAKATPQNFRFKLDTHTCGECKRAEYACICGH